MYIKAPVRDLVLLIFRECARARAVVIVFSGSNVSSLARAQEKLPSGEGQLATGAVWYNINVAVRFYVNEPRGFRTREVTSIMLRDRVMAAPPAPGGCTPIMSRRLGSYQKHAAYRGLSCCVLSPSLSLSLLVSCRALLFGCLLCCSYIHDSSRFNGTHSRPLIYVPAGLCGRCRRCNMPREVVGEFFLRTMRSPLKTSSEHRR